VGTSRTLIGGNINTSDTYVLQSVVKTNPDQIINLTSNVDLTTPSGDNQPDEIVRSATFVYVEAKQPGQYFRDL
jgi:hypothetical protein